MFSLAGNEKSGNVIAFRLSDNQLKKAIDDFRDEYGDGSKGIVTWERFCAYLGYSIDQVRECYTRGKSKVNAYSGRAEQLEVFYTECRAMMFETCGKHQSLAKTLAAVNHLLPEGQEQAPPEIVISFGGSDKRAMEAMK